MMSHARRHHYAVGYFESWDITSLQGVIDAAEVNRSPIIIGFSGEFLSRPERQAAQCGPGQAAQSGRPPSAAQGRPPSAP